MLLACRAEMQELVHWMIWADASYLENIYLCAQKLQVNFLGNGARLALFAVCVDHS